MAEAARSEAQRMLAAVAGQPEGAIVRIGVAEFRTLARLLDRVGSEAGRSGECSAGCMGAPIDGFRFWIPADQLARARDTAARHAADARASRAELRRIADARDSFSW